MIQNLLHFILWNPLKSQEVRQYKDAINSL